MLRDNNSYMACLLSNISQKLYYNNGILFPSYKLEAYNSESVIIYENTCIWKIDKNRNLEEIYAMTITACEIILISRCVRIFICKSVFSLRRMNIDVIFQKASMQQANTHEFSPS